MSIAELLTTLRSLQVDLSLTVNMQLKIVAPDGGLDAPVIAAIREHKEALIAHLEGAQPTVDEVTPVALASQYAVSHAQRRFWILHQLDESKYAYNVLFAFTLEDALDEVQLQAAVNKLLARHEILRTVFVSDESGLWQKIKQSAALQTNLAFTDLAVYSSEEGAARMKKLWARESQYQFDLQRGPLFRVHLVKQSEDKWMLIMNIHHIIADAWSLGVITHDLIQLYQSEYTGTPSGLTPLPFHYKDFAAWQNGLLENTEMQAHRAYWMQQFSGTLPVLHIATDTPRPARKSYDGAVKKVQLQGNDFVALQQMLQGQDTSIFMAMIAVVKTLLFRYTGQPDIILGTPVAGRNLQGLGNQVGCFVNTLALRTTFNGTDLFTELLQLVKDIVLDAYAHEAYPFDKLVEDLGIKSDQSRSVLFDAAITYQKVEESASGKTKSSRLTVVEDLDYGISKFDLTFIFQEFDGEMVVMINYCTALFTAERIDCMLEHLLGLIRAVSQNPEVPLSGIGYLPVTEKNKLLKTFNDTGMLYPQAATLHQLFTEQVQRAPAAPAIFFDNITWNYTQLDQESNRLAAHLQFHYGVRAGDKVGVILQRSDRLIILLLAILKSGAAYVPVDPEYPEDRIAYMIGDSQPRVVITEGSHEALAATGAVVVDYSRLSALPANPLRSNKPVANAMDLAYIIYTSGSTGRPKGVMVEHRSVVNLCCWHAGAFKVNEQARASVYAGVAFDALGWEIWPYLLHGACLYPVAQSHRTDADWLGDFFATHHITHAFLPTALYDALGAGLALPVNNDMQLLVGGDKLNKVYPGATVYNNYGPTENTVVTTSGLCKPGEEKITIGKPIANTRAYIVDAAMNLLPVGYPGELCVSGAGLAKGYLDQEARTAEKFVPNPFEPGTLLYKTGDLARWTWNGELEFYGRNDDQVKIRGYRIELGEIENVLRAYPNVKEAIILAPGEGTDRCLVAYIVWQGSGDEGALRAFAQQQLPQYMHPARYVSMDQLPLTGNGKVDRKQLPVPPLADTIGYAAARNAIEVQLVNIWEEVLQHHPVGIHDDFFVIGGHSLKGMRIMARVANTFRRSVSIKDLYEYPDIASFAAMLEESNGNAPTLLFKLTPSPRANALPLIFIPPIIGSATIYKPLASALQEDFACYGLQYPGFAGEGFAGSIEAMAHTFTEQLIPQISSDHFLLLGYSLGGLVAYETARQLEAKGKTVTLILLDKEVPPPAAPHAVAKEDFLDAIFEKEIKGWGMEDDPQQWPLLHAMFKAAYRAMIKYSPQGSIRGDILALEASGRQPGAPAVMQDWRSFTRGAFQHQWLSGNHYEVIRDVRLPLHIQQLELQLEKI